MALKQFQKALEIRVINYETESSEIASSYANIGNTKFDLGYYQEALNYLLKSVKIRNKNSMDSDCLIAFDYNSLGVAYYTLGIYEKALEYFNKAVKITQKCRVMIIPKLLIYIETFQFAILN